MARIRFSRLEDYELQLSKLTAKTEEIAGKAIYAGAAVITDAIRSSIQGLQAVSDREGVIAYQRKDPAPLTETAKQGLLDGLGITPMQDDGGYLNVKVGFDGYNGLRTQKYPNGQPNQLIARSLESGSSIAKKRPFVRPAINASRKQAENAMAKVINQELEKLMD